MSARLNMLVLGNMADGSNARSFRDAFSSLNINVSTVDTSPYESYNTLSPKWIWSRISDQSGPHAARHFLASLRRAVDLRQPDICFAFKTVRMPQLAMLDAMPGIRVHYSPDDTTSPANTSADYLSNESLWDLIVTTKKHNIQPIEARSRSKAMYMDSAFDPSIHLASPTNMQRTKRVGFIGAGRPDRADLPQQFALNAPGRAVIYGPRWRRVSGRVPSSVDMRGPVHGRDFISAATSFDIAPVLLNSDNKDTHTCRTFEMAAAGNVLLLPRTPDHERLFPPEAARWFTSRDEMWDEFDQLQRSSEMAKATCEKSFETVVRGNHTYRDRALQLLDHLGITQW